MCVRDLPPSLYTYKMLKHLPVTRRHFSALAPLLVAVGAGMTGAIAFGTLKAYDTLKVRKSIFVEDAPPLGHSWMMSDAQKDAIKKQEPFKYVL